MIGLPEAQINLAHATIHNATAPKSNAVVTAIGEALADVRAGVAGQVPKALRDAHYPGAKGLGHGAGYRYPHDDPRGVVTQQYAPDDIVDRDYYRPVGHGNERHITERLPGIRRIVRGTTSGTIGTDDAPAAPVDGEPDGPDASAATTSAREERA